MAKLTIHFEGLICHVGTDDVKTHAVLIHEPDAHTARVRSNGTAFGLQQWDTVTFEGPRAGRAQVDHGTFDARVPQLSRIIRNGGLIGDIFNQTHSQAAVVAYVKYPAGWLSAPQPHQRKLKLTLGGGTPVTQCIAAGVQFESEEFPDDDPVTMVITHHDDTGRIISVDPFPIDPTQEVMVDNVSGQGNHFHHFLRLTTANLIAKVVDSQEPCPDATMGKGLVLFRSKMEKEQQLILSAGEALDPTFRAAALRAHEMSASVNPECTNSQWP